MRKSMKFLILSALIAALAGGVACGDTDDGDGDGNNDPGNNDPGNNDPGNNDPGNNDPGDTFDTGLPEDKKLSEVTEADAATACASFDAQSVNFEEDFKNFACFFGGVFTALFTDKSPATCEASVEQCLQEEPEEDDQECVFEPTDCEATVGEMEACVNEQFAAIKAFNATFDCAEALAEANPEANPLEPGPLCQAVQEKCPELFEDEEEG